MGDLLVRWRAWRADARAARRNRSRARECFYCGVAFDGRGALERTVDHRLPRSRGGAEGLANLVFACRACNQRKADQLEADFVRSAWLAERRRQVASGGLGSLRSASTPPG